MGAKDADFSGWATKAGLKCSDGLVIAPNAFEHQDTLKVPLVWQHGHKDVENVLGHAILENRKGGVYCYGYFNSSAKAAHARGLLEHKDITMMSIWANELMKSGNKVLHGAIREVSLVLSGANPGALIENVTLRHSDGSGDEILDDEFIIYTGLSFEHTNTGGQMTDTREDKTKVIEIYDSMTPKQKEFLHTMLGEALNDEDADALKHAKDETVGDVYDSMNDKQQQVLHYLVGAAMDGTDTLKQDALDDDDDDDDKNDTKTKKGGEVVKHNVFEDDKGKGKGDEGVSVISHDDMKEIIEDAKRNGSLKYAVENYAKDHLEHGISDIDTLFPDAVSTDNIPEFLQRRVEWVASFLGATTKSPFSRIKTFNSDITMEEARAKGYVTGALKREEFFTVAKRNTDPTTVYKKQSLDRDDVVDITDFDVVVWLKGEMRIMLDEEIARAALIGDGRDISSEDKINEQCIRPIAKEHELYATTININLGDASSSIQELIDAVILNRRLYKGTGTPNFYTSETVLARFLLLKDTLGRSIYKNIEEVASVLRVSTIIPVEAMDEEPDLVGIMVNPVDYRMGATRGGEVTLFDDFDIDYNKQKYLIETRMSGALTKLKSALVIRQVDAGDALITPTAPTFDADLGELTIHDTAHVVYKNADTDAVLTNGGSPYSVASGDSITVVATPASGYYFETSDSDDWTFTAL